MTDKIMHSFLVALLLMVATILILFGHQYIDPNIVFTSIIAGLAGIIGGRIASNGYVPTIPPLPPVSGSSSDDKNSTAGGTQDASQN